MKKFNRVCISASVYNLFLYLLVSTEEEYKSTFFFLSDCIPESIRSRIDNQKLIPYLPLSKWEKVSALIKCRIFSRHFYPFLNRSRIYAQDHLKATPYILGNRKYTLIEDSPNFLSLIKAMPMWRDCEEYKRTRNVLHTLKDNIVSKSIAGIMGNNELCEEVILTTDDNTTHLYGKVLTKIDIYTLWRTSSQEKKDSILRLFAVTERDITVLRSKSIILFTQPLIADMNLTESEQLQIYKDAISKYDKSKVVIKTHPRDGFDYSKFFPNIELFNKPVPFQLLDLLGIRFETAITICSSSVTSIPYDIKIDWIGSGVHPKILFHFGTMIPEAVKRKMI